MSNIKEANSRHSFVAAQQALTPRARDIKNALSKTARAKAATKKYARRISTISPDYSKQDVIDQLKSMGEETRLPPKFYAKIVAKLNKKKAGVKEDVQQIAEAGYGFVAPAIPDVVTKRHLDDALFDVHRWRTDRTQGPSNPNYVNAKNHYHKLRDKADKSVVKAHFKKILKDTKDASGWHASVQEDVQQIAEVGDTPKGKAALASYVKKAAPQIRSNTTLKKDFEDEKYRYLKIALKHSPNVDPHKTHERDPEKRANAEYLGKGASDLSDKFGLKAKNRIKGIQRAATRLAKEEVEQIDELSKDTLSKYIKSAEADTTNKNREATKNRLVGKRSPRHADAQAAADALDRARNKRLNKMDLARAKMAKEEVELDEVLKPSMGASAYISDFVHSKNPKFAGKSKAERTKMALGAYYGAKKAMKEGLDPVGKEDADVNNDGKHGHSTDKYLLKRRAAISKAIASKKG